MRSINFLGSTLNNNWAKEPEKPNTILKNRRNSFKASLNKKMVKFSIKIAILVIWPTGFNI